MMKICCRRNENLQHFVQYTCLISKYMKNVPTINTIDFENQTALKTLIGKIEKGDKDAFQIIVITYQHMVSSTVYRMVNHSADVEDLSQDIFIKIYNNLHRFRYESKFSTWIMQITYNTTLNFIQKKKPQLTEKEILETTPDMTLAKRPDKRMEALDMKQHIHKAIAQLPLQYRTVLTMYHLNEMHYNEIGAILNMPEGTVKNYLFRARKMLKTHFETQYRTEKL